MKKSFRFRKISKTLSVLLLLTAVAVTQVPVSDVEAVAPPSDFQMDGTKLLKYSGTAEVVSIPDGIKEIGEEAFAGNDNIVKVTIGGQVRTVGYRAFADCGSLRTIQVGDQVEEIGTAAFSNNKELINVSLGSGVKTLGSGVFAGCSQLKELTVSEDSTHLWYSSGVLYDQEQTRVYALMPACEKGAYTLPGTVREITAYAFWGNPYLEKVKLGSSLAQVPAYAFSNCINLKEVEIPLTVRGIEGKAFEDCVNLAKVVLPDSMAVISDTAFDGCPNVKFVAAPGTYGAEFAAAFDTSDVEKTEYEDVKDSEVVYTGTITGNTIEAVPSPMEEAAPSPESSPSPSPEPSPSPTPELPSITDAVSNKTILGESSIVSGRAVIFIDNSQSNVIGGNNTSVQIDLTRMEDQAAIQAGSADIGETESIGGLLADNAQKGKDFPKYTIVNDTRIAAQAFYQDSDLTEYQIDEGITEIGEFAFARSGLMSVVIPEGVTKIGYGAFYHCDDLREVTIPDSVTEIEPYAFDKTPWVTDMRTSTYPYLIAGDGILIAYAGSGSVVNIPDGVKQIGPGVFKEHKGITAVNLPETVTVIGEEAFMNCRNLKTINGGGNLVKVKDRAFMNCPLSRVTIPKSMQEVGLGAYALSGGTDTAVFEGSILPTLSMEESAGRLANKEYRTYAFGEIKNAIIPDEVESLAGTVLEPGLYGFHGIVTTSSGIQAADNREGVAGGGKSQGVALRISSGNISQGKNERAAISGNNDPYLLKVVDSEDAAQEISAAYGELYGGKEPSGLHAYDMSLYDDTGSIPIIRLGRQAITVQFKMPAGIKAEGLHVVTLDQDGQLEALEHRIVELEDGDYLQFTTSHFSPVGIYNYPGGSSRAGNTGASSAKDDTPDTGDPIHPKWFLALGLFAGAVALFFYGMGSRRRGGRMTIK